MNFNLGLGGGSEAPPAAVAAPAAEDGTAPLPCYAPLGPEGDAELAALGFDPGRQPRLNRYLMQGRRLRAALPACPK